MTEIFKLATFEATPDLMYVNQPVDVDEWHIVPEIAENLGSDDWFLVGNNGTYLEYDQTANAFLEEVRIDDDDYLNHAALIMWGESSPVHPKNQCLFSVECIPNIKAIKERIEARYSHIMDLYVGKIINL